MVDLGHDLDMVAVEGDLGLVHLGQGEGEGRPEAVWVSPDAAVGI
jgi:hypothetical protein